MACALFGINLCRFKVNFKLTDSAINRTDIQDISRPSQHEAYRPYSHERYIGNGTRVSAVNRITPSMVSLPISKHDNSKRVPIATSAAEIVQIETSPRRKYKPTVALAAVSIDIDDFASENSVRSVSTRPTSSPPPFYEAQTDRNSPTLSTFRPNESETTESSLPSTWDMIIEHRQNISRLPEKGLKNQAI